MTSAAAFVTDPSFGLPLLLLGGALLTWWALNLHEYPTNVRRPTARPVPDRDPVSRTVVAFGAGRFSELLERAGARLDESSERRYGRPAMRLPRMSWSVSKLPNADPVEVRRLRRLRVRVGRMEDASLRRESGVWFRLAFWRTRAAVQRRFRAELAPLLDEVGRATAPIARRSA